MAPRIRPGGGDHGRRLMFAVATSLVTVNIWTGAPLAALWAGSVIVGGQQLTMASLLVVLVVLAVLMFGLAYVLLRLNAAYEELQGTPRRSRRTSWLRSVENNAEDHGEHVSMNLVEGIVVAMVYLVVTGLVVWLVFFAGSMLPANLRGA